MSLNGDIQCELKLFHNADFDLTSAEEIVIGNEHWLSWAVTDGTGANQADMAWHDQRTLGAGASENLDLYGSLTDAFGSTMNFARIKALQIVADSDNGSTITVGGAAANPWYGIFGAANDVLKIRAGSGCLFIAADATAWPVTDSSADILKVLNDDGGDTATYKIVIIGASA